MFELYINKLTYLNKNYFDKKSNQNNILCKRHLK